MEESPPCRTALNLSMILVMAGILLTTAPFAVAQEWTRQAPAPAPKGSWSDKSLSPDQRADLLIQQMTLEENFTLVHGDEGEQSLKKWLGGAGYVPGVPRLGIPRVTNVRWKVRCRQHRPHRALRDCAPFGFG